MTKQEKASPVAVRAEPDSRLEQLLAQHDVLKAAADEAAARFKAVADAIKVEAQTAAYDAERDHSPTEINITSPYLDAPLRLSYVERWTLDAKRMKAEDPATYVTYARKSGSWVLKAVQV